MAIDNNLYEKSIKILTDLIAFQTVSGTDNSELINYCEKILNDLGICLLYTSPSPRDRTRSRMPSSA